MAARVTVIKYLANLGYGTRREVTALVNARRLTQGDGRVVREHDPWTHDSLRVDGDPLDPPPGSVVLLHKPTGYVTSTHDVPPLVYELLPPRFVRRTPVMAAVGRLDRDTSGLLLFTDDGALNHRLTSPKSHVPKCYRVTLAEPLRGDESAALASGTVLLKGETEPLAPATLVVIDDCIADVTISEGRYHQVRRMFAALGNHVTALHRTTLGTLALGDLGEGTWRVLTANERTALEASAAR
jgi:16S rRNA pseudouridine516 synthase